MTTRRSFITGLLIALIIGFVGGEFYVDRAITGPGFRVGIGSCAATLQETSRWKVISQIWFPWCSR